MQPELDRGYVQRVRIARVAGRDVALLDVRMPRHTVHLICAAGLGVGVVDPEHRGRLRRAIRANPAARTHIDARWRARFEGASLVGVGLHWIDLAREGQFARAEAGRGSDLGNPILDRFTDSDSSRVAHGEPAPRELLEQRGAAIVDELTRLAPMLAQSERREALQRALARAISRVSRRVSAVEGDLTRIASAEALASRAQMFVAAASMAQRGADRLRAVDWTSGSAEPVELAIDPARGAREQIDAIFRRAHRLRDGARIARSRRADAVLTLQLLQAGASELVSDRTDLAQLETRARAAAPHDFMMSRRGSSTTIASTTRTTRGRAQAPHSPHRTFVGVAGARILVGRSAVHNDTLTWRVARPQDLWLHAKDVHGAHVVVSMTKGASCPQEVLVDAAHLAAHFSDARGERIVDVQYTPRRYLRKPRGSPPGLVVVQREKVLVLRKDEGVLKRLLDAEVV